MITAKLGAIVPLSLQICDGSVDKYPIVNVKTPTTGAILKSSPLVHIGGGQYVYNYTTTNSGYFLLQFIVYKDSGHVTEVGMKRVEDLLYIENQSSVNSNMANAVWDALVSGHIIAGTFGDYIQAIHQYVQGNNSELVSGSYGLEEIRDHILQNRNQIITEIDNNESKIDSIIPVVNQKTSDIIDEVEQNRLDISDLSNDLSSTKTDIVNEVNVNESKIDSLSDSVGSLSNNTTVRLVVPDKLVRPSVGSKTYQFHIRLFDDIGNPEAPDSSPTIRIRNLQSGVDIVLNSNMLQDGTKVGAYYYNFTIDTNTVLAHYLVEVTVTEQGVSRYIPATTELCEYSADLDAIQVQLGVVDNKIDANKSLLENPVYGLQSIKIKQGVIVSEVNENQGILDIIKSKTNNLPADPASESSLSNISSSISNLPSILDIKNELDYLRQVIQGSSAITLTGIYNKIDYSQLLKTNDPRIAYLDAPISSRSTIAPSDIWSYTNRTLTAFNLSVSDIAMFWDYAVADADSPGSMGERIVSFLDTKITTRATKANVASLLIDMAKESTVGSLSGKIENENNENQLLINQVLVLVDTIKGKTDNIPTTPANQITLELGINEAMSALADLMIYSILIRSKTDNIPTTPSTKADVEAIPTNPVLSNDPRLSNLNNLDGKISEIPECDISTLSTKSQLLSTKNEIVSKVDQNGSKLDDLNCMVDEIPTSPEIDTKLSDKATSSDVLNAKQEVLEALPDESGTCPTPAELWSYSNRTLTETGVDLSDVAKKSDIEDLAKTVYINRMTTVVIGASQEMLVWPDRDGQMVTGGSNCNVTVKDSNGIKKWTSSSSTPNADGIFRFINPITVSPNQNFYVIIEIEVDGKVRTSTQTFFTVG